MKPRAGTVHLPRKRIIICGGSDMKEGRPERMRDGEAEGGALPKLKGAAAGRGHPLDGAHSPAYIYISHINIIQRTDNSRHTTDDKRHTTDDR